MKKSLLVLAAMSIFTSCNQTSNEKEVSNEKLALNVAEETFPFYGFQVKDINGEDFSFAQLKGKRVLIVNTASKCGYTPQYEGLQELYNSYGGDNFTIVGFPCNQFGNQEPGTNEDIKSFCEKNYGVSFLMMDKVDVKGDKQHPVYAWLTNVEMNKVDDARVKWNFNKFLIDENGNWVAHYGSGTKPMDEEIVNFASGK
jgi:glutathione peroxidase